MANNPNSFKLSAQMPDRLRVQEYNKKTRGNKWFEKGINYPDDGFVYLYPRLCDNELSLLQMVDPSDLDPDDMIARNPIFRRREPQ